MTEALVRQFRQALKDNKIKITPDVLNYARSVNISTKRGTIITEPPSPVKSNTASAADTTASMTSTPQSTSPQIISMQQQLIAHIQATLGDNTVKQTLVDKVKSAQDVQKLRAIAELLQQIVQAIKQADK